MSILVFNKWNPQEAEVTDKGLQRYMTLEPRYRSRTGARYAGKRFYKSKIFIVERFMNKLMVHGHRAKKHKMTSGHACGNAALARRLVLEAFSIIEQKIKKNPVAVFVKAVENAAPREEIITIEYGGARYPKAVDCAPQRRIDIALRLLVHGASDRAFKKKKKMAETVADEIIAAHQLSSDSLAISKKGELERQADSSR